MGVMRAEAAISVNGIEARYNSRPVLHGVTMDVAPGEWLGILGPNGSGKTTLLRTVSGYLEPTRGGVYLEGRPMVDMGRKEAARRLAVSGSGSPGTGSADFTAGELVLMGRTPHLSRWSAEGPNDEAIARRALAMTNTAHLAHRAASSLSAGEYQRVLLAAALAQEPAVLLLDEPTAHLDIHHQVEVMHLMDHLRREQGITVVSVLHDLNLAALFCDRLMLLKEGRIHAMGPPWHVLTEHNVRDVYGCSVEIFAHPRRDAPQLILLPEPPTGGTA